MVGREVDGPLCAVLRRSWGLCGRSWVALGAYVGGLGPLLGPMLAVLGRSWPSAGGLGPLLGPMLAILVRSRGLSRRSWGVCWRSWAALGAYVGGLGLLLGPM